jgi:hypothetical protein
MNPLVSAIRRHWAQWISKLVNIMRLGTDLSQGQLQEMAIKILKVSRRHENKKSEATANKKS